MTTLELTWQTDPNRVPTQSTLAEQGKWLLWYLKAFPKGDVGGATLGLWTCEGSSDSVTAVMDGADRWGTSFDASKVVRGNGAVLHSWIVLKSPDGLGPWYMCIDYQSTTDTLFSVAFSKTAFTGGSITARPTSTTEWTYAAQQFTVSPLVTSKVHGSLATTGEFHMRFSQDASALFTFSCSFLTLASTKTGDAHNGWSYVGYNAATRGAWQRANFNSAASARLKGRDAGNTTSVVASILVPHVSASTTEQAMGSSEIATTDATDSAYNDFPAYLQVTTAGSKSLRGRVRDLYLAPELVPVGNVEPSSGPPYDTVIVGDTWQPWSSSSQPSL